MNDASLAILLAVIAFLYASVGHGGASGYIAAMTLLGFTPEVVRPTALVLNLFVSVVAFMQFSRAGHFRWRMFWPFALASVPCAWLGARIQIDALLYKRVLALCLLVAVGRMLGLFGTAEVRRPFPPLAVAMLIGALIGLVSGMIGIGGGILLSPLLLVFGWSAAKESAAISAAFIFVNSAAGLAGLVTTQDLGMFGNEHLLWMATAVVGGWLGAYVGAQHFTQVRLRQVLSLVLLVASFKLVFT